MRLDSSFGSENTGDLEFLYGQHQYMQNEKNQMSLGNQCISQEIPEWLEEKLNKLTQQNEKLKELIIARQQEIEKYKKERINLKNDLTEYYKKVAAIQDECSYYKSSKVDFLNEAREIFNSKQEIVQREHERIASEFREKIQHLREQLDHLENTRQQERTIFDQETAEKVNLINVLKGQHQNLELQLRRMQQCTLDAERDLQRMTYLCNEKERQLIEVQKQNEVISCDAERQQKEKDKLWQEQLDAKSDEIHGLFLKLKTLQLVAQSKEDQEETQVRLDRQVAQTKEEEQSDKLKQYQKDIQTLQEEFQQLKMQLGQMQRENSMLKQQTNDLQQENKKLIMQNDNLKSDQLQQKQIISDLTKRNEILKHEGCKTAKDLENKVQEEDLERRKTREKLTMLQNEIVHLSEERQLYAKQAEQNGVEFLKVRGYLDKLTVTVSQDKNTISQLERRNQELNHTKIQLQSQINELQHQIKLQSISHQIYSNNMNINNAAAQNHFINAQNQLSIPERSLSPGLIRQPSVNSSPNHKINRFPQYFPISVPPQQQQPFPQPAFVRYPLHCNANRLNRSLDNILDENDSLNNKILHRCRKIIADP